MSALDKIIAGIEGQAHEKAQEIAAEAAQQAAEILRKSEAAHVELRRQLDEATERECREILLRAQSAGQQSRRSALLHAKGQAIDEVMAEAKVRIAGMTDAEYVDFLYRLYQKNAQPRDGVLHFASADRHRIPEGFLERCKQVFPAHSLEVAEDRDGISGGFIIAYGDIFENCAIEDIFAAEEQRLRDKAYEILSADA